MPLPKRIPRRSPNYQSPIKVPGYGRTLPRRTPGASMASWESAHAPIMNMAARNRRRDAMLAQRGKRMARKVLKHKGKAGLAIGAAYGIGAVARNTGRAVDKPGRGRPTGMFGY